MQTFEKIQEYATAVCDQIKWKKAHAVISEEIENHLIDQRDAYMAGGAGETAATNKAIVQMGDPIAIGTQLDRTHRPKPQWSMMLLTAALLFTGFLIRILIVNNGSSPWPMPMQLISAVIGLGLMAAAYFTDFTLIGKYPKAIYFSILALSVAALIILRSGDTPDFRAGLMALLFPLGFAAIVYAVRNKGYSGIILCGMSFLLPACIALLVPTVSGFLLFAVSGLVILSIAISKRWFKVKILYGYLLVFMPVAVVFLLGALNMSHDSYRWERLQVAIDPSIDPNGAGYMGMLIRTLLKGSKLVGHGVMPAAATVVPWSGNDTDYLLTSLIFNIGWIAFIIVMGALLFFIVKGFLLCFRQRSGLALFVSASVMLTFTIQVIGYVAANLGFQLTAPISLPLLSHGNIATIINLR